MLLAWGKDRPAFMAQGRVALTTQSQVHDGQWPNEYMVGSFLLTDGEGKVNQFFS
jgi:hypothetical protein